jgi:predicted ATPase
VHFAARVGASAHGGQVVLSQATRALVDRFPLTDLGEHRLKDIDGAVSIYQLGSERFPPLKTISNTNLPRPASSFVGRERELAEVLAKVEAGARLLTFTGPGGSGKTRLAIEAAAGLVPSYKAGVFWVGLASLREPSLVTETIAQTLGAKDGLAEQIGKREMLLLLDNLEQVIEAAPELSALLTACPNLALLCTSRELLRVRGEVEYQVAPLASLEAVALFCERSGLERSGEIVELCARLDDLPLAVELAAARTKALSPAQILDRLSDRLDLLRGGRDADARQQTLRATIAWSYDLLSEEEQPLFRSLSVFAGGCTLGSAEEVVDADLDTLQSVVEKSLLRFTDERYWMLETIREYATERLEQSQGADALRRRHAKYFLRLAEEAEPHLTGAEQGPWLERLEAEHDNFRRTLDTLRQTGSGAEELQLAGALMRFWYVRGYLREGRSRCEDALAAHHDQSPPRLKALFGAELLAHRLGDYQRAEVRNRERLALARQLGDTEAVASSLIGVGVTAHAVGDSERAAAALIEAAELARAGGYAWNLATAIWNLGDLALEQGDYTQARARYEESLGLFREVGDERTIMQCLGGLGVLASREGRSDEAEALLRESLEYAEALADKELAIWCLGELAALAVSAGDAQRAAKLLGAIETLRQETGHVAQPEERRVDDQTRTALAAKLGDEDLAAALLEGREMTFEQTLAYALKTADPD